VPSKKIQKRKGKFLLGSALQVFGRSGGDTNADEAKQNYFCGRKRICFASALFQNGGDFTSAAQEGAGGMRGRFCGIQKILSKQGF
jgi:hypothetical protein